MPQIGLTELLIIAALAVLLFGSRLPGVGKALGSGIRNFKKGLAGGNDDTETPPGSSKAGLSEGMTSHSGTPGTPVDDAGGHESRASSSAGTTGDKAMAKARVQTSNPPTPLAGSTHAASAGSAPRQKVVDVDGEPQG